LLEDNPLLEELLCPPEPPWPEEVELDEITLPDAVLPPDPVVVPVPDGLSGLPEHAATSREAATSSGGRTPSARSSLFI
jgi:hypothetical protein